MGKTKCVICGKMFMKRRADSVCCSNKCKNLKFSRQRSARLKEKAKVSELIKSSPYKTIEIMARKETKLITT